MLYQFICVLGSIFICNTTTPNEIDLNSNVTAVTVYSQEAFVTRETEAVVPEYNNQVFAVKKLSRFIDRSSINVKLNGSGMINSIKFVKTPIVEKIDTVAMIDLQPLIDLKNDSIAKIENDLIALLATKDYLDKTKPIQDVEFKLSSAEYKDAYTFYRQELKDVNNEIFLLNNEKESLRQSIVALENL